MLELIADEVNVHAVSIDGCFYLSPRCRCEGGHVL